MSYKHTNFTAGFCLFKPKKRDIRFALPQNFVAPVKLDFRDMCLSADDQGNTPTCVAHATAGFIEVESWRLTHVPKQLDAMAIYNKAKEIDGDGQDGTTLESAGLAAIALGLIKAVPTYLNDCGIDALKFAIHTHCGCVLGLNITEEWNSVGEDGRLEIIPNAKVLGGHGIYACAYDAYGPWIQNSWGPTWALNGFGHLSWNQYQQQWMDGAVLIPESEINEANDVNVFSSNPAGSV